MIAMERPPTQVELLLESIGAPRPYYAPAIEVERVSSVVAFAGLRAEWTELLEASGASVFNSWEWLYPWYMRLGRDRQLYILAARDELGKLLGLMPLCLQTRRALGRTVRRLAFLGETHVCGDFTDVLAMPEHHAAVVEACAHHLQAAGDWDVLDLADMDSVSPTPGELEGLFPEKQYVRQRRQGDVCPRITFAQGEQFEEFLKASGRAENYRRRRKWLEKQPGYSIDCEMDPARLTVPFSEFLRLHALRWKPEGGSDGIEGPDVEAFHRDATALLAECGKLQLFTLNVGGRAVASIYGVLNGDAFNYYQAGRDPEWHNKSVGLVLLVETIKRSLERGDRVFDFLRGEEGYKAEWSNGQRQLVGLRIYPHGGSGAWLDRQEQLQKQARTLAKRFVPQSLVNRVKGVRG